MFSNRRWGSSKHEKPLNFNPALNYDDVLNTMKAEFLERWSNVKPSPFRSLDDHDFIAYLGVGSFGRVSLCRDKETGTVSAVKVMLKENTVKYKQINHVFNEKQVLHSNKFPFLVSLEFSRKDNDYLYLAMPYLCGGELFSYLRKVRKFTEDQAKFYASQVFLGLEYMHHNDLIYRDLKPENVLLDRNGYVRIADFGFTKKVKDRTMTLCGTPEYFAPELILAKPYGCSVDWWAFGVFVFELVAGFSPFVTTQNELLEMYTRICDCDYKLPTWFSSSLKDLVYNLLQIDLSKRYGNMYNGEKDIKDHAWFASVNWYAMLNQLYEPHYIPKVTGEDDYRYFQAATFVAEERSNENRYADIFEDF